MSTCCSGRDRGDTSPEGEHCSYNLAEEGLKGGGGGGEGGKRGKKGGERRGRMKRKRQGGGRMKREGGGEVRAIHVHEQYTQHGIKVQ